MRSRNGTSDSSVRDFVYDPDGKLIGDYLGSNQQETVWLGDMPIALLSGTSTIQYIHADHLNTPRAISGTTGAVLWRWDSDAFGNGLPNEDVDGDGLKVTYNLRFPGQYYDGSTGKHYNYFRDYDPVTGRYLQSDPIGVAGGFNIYLYVNANPLRNTDPTGEKTEPNGIGIGALLRAPTAPSTFFSDSGRASDAAGGQSGSTSNTSEMGEGKLCYNRQDCWTAAHWNKALCGGDPQCLSAVLRLLEQCLKGAN